MGNSIEQYRAAIGIFYMACRHVTCSAQFVCHIFNFFSFFKRIPTICCYWLCRISSLATHVTFFMHFLFFILILSGDIETNPGPSAESVLDIFHLNIRSLRNKIDSLNAIVSEFAIVCFTETHLDNKIANDDISLDGFSSIFRKDRNAYGGGVIIYSSNNVRVSRRNDLEPANVELVWLEIDNPTSQIFLCCVYRPPNADSSFWRNFSWSLDKACEISDKIIIVGDINVDLFNTPDTHIIYDIISNCQLVNIIKDATRITNSSRTLIDPIFTTQSINVTESGTLNAGDNLSDHMATFLSITVKYKTNQAYQRKVWIYKEADFDKLNNLISHCDWNNLITDAPNIDTATENFSTQYLSFVRECVPEKSVTIRPRDKPWFDSTLRKNIRTRDRLRKKALNSKKEIDWVNYHKHRNKVNNMKKYALSNY